MRANTSPVATKATPKDHLASSEAPTGWPASRILWASWAIGTALIYGDLYLSRAWQVPAAVCGLAVMLLGAILGWRASVR